MSPVSVLVMVLLVSKFPKSDLSNCNGTTEKSMRAKFQLVKFDQFFSEFKPLKSYSYSTTKYNYANSAMTCINEVFKYKVRLNWSKTMGVLQFYTNLTTNCVVYTLFKDGKGFLRVRAGIVDQFLPGEYQIGFYDDAERRIYFIEHELAAFVTEFWLVKTEPEHAVDEGRGPTCNKSLLDLNPYNKPKVGINKKVVVICYIVGVVTGIAAVVWLMLHCLQELQIFCYRKEVVTKE